MNRNEALEYLKSIDNTPKQDYFFDSLDETDYYTSFQAIDSVEEIFGNDMANFDKDNKTFKEVTASLVLIGASSKYDLFMPTDVNYSNCVEYVLVPEEVLTSLVKQTQNHFKGEQQ